ncbi:hypothetical protein [Alkaliphilus serpentinus]|uniref:Uncharacterized protein n=1 Tax=Alkaliphilus serpentinus TaxID=1482731 RepID=A0A833HNZ3_9FIRM|nr:hypothetical protein [Alkaliphilus serpentinus]KAB3529207.1 hypothetical protein F8153_09795 [Alkaliphilus serpentinus]
MKEKNHKGLEDLIKATLRDELISIEVDDGFIEKTLTISKGITPSTALERFLEREIAIPVSFAAIGCLLAIGLLVNTLLIPKELSHPKYEIRNLSSTITLISDSEGIIKGDQ